MRGHLNGNSLRTDLTGKNGLKKNRYLGDRARTGGTSLGEGKWVGAVRAGVGAGVGGESGAGAGGAACGEATMESGARPVDLCWPGLASGLPGQVLPSRGPP